MIFGKTIDCRIYPFRVLLAILMVSLLAATLFAMTFPCQAAPLVWGQVNTDGFGDTYNQATYAMQVYGGDLYVGTVNSTTGTEVWRLNGSGWSQVNIDGFGDDRNTHTYCMATYGGSLFVGTWNMGNAAEVWAYDGSAWSQSNSNGFENPNNLGVLSMAVYNGNLYACTMNQAQGCEVWAYDGTTWSPSATGGFDTRNNGYCYNLATYNGDLYAGTMNYSTGAEVWAFDGSAWGQVNPDGFGDTNNLCHSMLEYNGNLYVGTYNGAVGSEIWQYNGSSWLQVNADGYGKGTANVTSRSMTVYNDRLYVGTQNAAGGEVWSYDGTTWEMANMAGFEDINNKRCYATAVYEQRLYAGTYNTVSGVEVWKNSAPVLALDKSANPSGSVTSGQVVTYSLAASNSGDLAATGCSLRDAVPTYTTYVENSTTLNGTAVPDNGGTTPLVSGLALNSPGQPGGTIAAGAQATVTFQVKVGSDIPAGASIRNVGVLSADGQPDLEASVVNPYASNLPTTWYFAEGSTQPGFDEYILLCNVDDNDMTATITYITDKGVEKQFTHEVPAHSRRTVLANAEMPNESGLAAIIQGTGGFICERSLYFNHSGIDGGHQAIGCDAPGSDLFFAEGFTGLARSPFDEWILVLNPGTTPANLHFTYMFPGGNTEERDYQVAGRSRLSVNVDREIGEGHEVSTRVQSDQAVVAERAMYFFYQDVWSGGHVGKATTETRNDWYLAEGFTGWQGSPFDEYILVANNNPSENQVQVTFMFPDGSTQTFDFTAAPTSRLTVYADSCVGENKMISAHIHADLPVVVERAMYFDYRLRWMGGSNCVGAASPKSDLYFAEGYTGNSASQFETWLLIQNTSAEGKTAVIDYMLTSGEVVLQEVALAPHSRTTIYTNDVLGKQSVEFSMRLRSKDGSASLLAERAMYFDYRGFSVHAQGGDVVPGF
jgi:uncharacterized repeat protein (TIGR01451 family)